MDAPLSLTVYPGADGSFRLYEDDGSSFNYRKGEWMGIDVRWDNAARKLSLRLAEGSRMLPPLKREIEVRLDQTTRAMVFDGRPAEVKL